MTTSQMMRDTIKKKYTVKYRLFYLFSKVIGVLTVHEVNKTI